MMLVAVKNSDSTATILGWITSMSEEYVRSRTFHVPYCSEMSTEVREDAIAKHIWDIAMTVEKVIYLGKERLILVAEQKDLSGILKSRMFEPLSVLDLLYVKLR